MHTAYLKLHLGLSYKMLRSTLSQEIKAERLLFCVVVDAGLTGVMVCCCDCKYRHQCKTEPNHASESREWQCFVVVARQGRGHGR